MITIYAITLFNVPFRLSLIFGKRSIVTTSNIITVSKIVNNTGPHESDIKSGRLKATKERMSTKNNVVNAEVIIILVFECKVYTG